MESTLGINPGDAAFSVVAVKEIQALGGGVVIPSLRSDYKRTYATDNFTLVPSLSNGGNVVDLTGTTVTSETEMTGTGSFYHLELREGDVVYINGGTTNSSVVVTGFPTSATAAPVIATVASVGDSTSQRRIRHDGNQNLYIDSVSTDFDDAARTLLGGSSVLVSTSITGASTTSAILTQVTDSTWEFNHWLTSDMLMWEATIRPGTDITSSVFFAGLKLTNTSDTTDSDQAFFRVSTADSNTTFHVIENAGGTASDNDSLVAYEASSRYSLQVVINSARVPTFFINNRMVASSGEALQDIELFPFIGIQSLTAATHRYFDAFNTSISAVKEV